MKKNTAEFPKKYEGLSQYRPPLCFELTGRSFTLAFSRDPVSTLALIPARIRSHTVLYTKDLGDRDVHGTALGTIVAGRTLDGMILGKLCLNPLDDFLLLC